MYLFDSIKNERTFLYRPGLFFNYTEKIYNTIFLEVKTSIMAERIVLEYKKEILNANGKLDIDDIIIIL